MKIESASDFERWNLERKLVEGQLARIERECRLILTEIGLPIDPGAIEEILSGSAPHSWAPKTRERDRLRAKFAMHAMIAARDVRGYLGPDPDTENPRLAAFAALVAGAYAGDVVIASHDAALGARRRVQKRRASLTAARGRTENAGKYDERIRAEAAAYRSRHPYSREHSTRALAAHLSIRIRRKVSTIRARLAALGLR